MPASPGPAKRQRPATPSVSLTTAEGVDTRDLRSAFTGGAFTAALVDAAIDAAETVWQDKRCLELEVDPPGKEVDPGSETEIAVKIEHKAFDEEVERDVKATLEGTEEVDSARHARQGTRPLHLHGDRCAAG